MERVHKQVNTVHEKDLDGLLSKLGLSEKFEGGKLYCKFCKNVVNRENIYSVLPETGSVNIICDKPQCITDLLQYLEEKKRTKLEQ